MLTWLQFEDLHASDSDGWSSLDIFSKLIEDANQNLSDTVDFAILPGDNANHATPEQYRNIADTASRLRLPLHILPGDHGAGLSNLTAGFVVPWFNYPIGFLYLAGIAVCGLMFFATMMPETRPADDPGGADVHKHLGTARLAVKA